MPVEGVKVEGLREFRKELKALEGGFPKELQKANKAASELIAEGTRQSFASRGGVAPKVAPSVKALAQQARAQVKIGGDKYPYAMGSEFGSIAHKQFPAWSGSDSSSGYSLYETVRKRNNDVRELYGQLIDDIATRAFPD